MKKDSRKAVFFRSSGGYRLSVAVVYSLSPPNDLNGDADYSDAER
jgi:hypothetical protein